MTAPVTPGNVWTPERISWLTGFHADRRPGLEGPAGEATWAVEVDGDVSGAVRLKRTDEAGVLVTGIWLTRRVRGGVSHVWPWRRSSRRRRRAAHERSER